MNILHTVWKTITTKSGTLSLTLTLLTWRI